MPKAWLKRQSACLASTNNGPEMPLIYLSYKHHSLATQRAVENQLVSQLTATTQYFIILEKEQNSKFEEWFLLNAYHLHITIKL
jgi:hypothetical protein